MADRAREVLDAYAARCAGLDGTNSIGTIGELAPEAIDVLRRVLAYADDFDLLETEEL